MHMIRCIEALLVVAACTLVRWILDPVLGDHQAFLASAVAIVIVAARGSRPAGIVALVAGFLAAWYLFEPPRHTWSVTGPGHALSLILYAVLGVIILMMITWLLDARTRVDDIASDLRKERDCLRSEMSQRRRLEAEVTRSREELRAMLWQAPVGIIQGDAAGVCTFVNPAWCEIGGLRSDDVVGRSLPSLVHPDDAHGNAAAWEVAVRERRVFRHTVRMARPDGRWSTVLASALPLFGSEGAFEGSLTAVVDITETIDLESRRRTLESYVESLMHNTSAVVYLKDLEGRFLMVNHRYEAIFPHMKNRCIGTAAEEWFPPDLARRFAIDDAQVLGTGDAIVVEEEVPQNGSVRNYLTVKFPVFDAQRRVIAVGGMATDITDTKVARARLESNQRVLRRLLEEQERERRFLCHEFHDGPIQYAVGAHMVLETLCDRLDGTENGSMAETVRTFVRRSIDEARQVIRGIRPTELDDLGLAAAIKQLADTGVGDPSISVTTTGDLEGMNEVARITIYRVCQEALANARRHSGAGRIEVRVERRDAQVEVHVHDDGRGFDVEEARRDGFGIVGMIERVQLAGGECVVLSAPGNGTTVTVSLPIPGGDRRAVRNEAGDARP